MLEKLKIIDPDLAHRLVAGFENSKTDISPENLLYIESEIIKIMEQDLELGERVSAGYARLLGKVSWEYIEKYRAVYNNACKKGLHVSRIMARHFVPVLFFGDDDLIERFLRVTWKLAKKGEYLLKKPLATISGFLEKGEISIALSFLGLLNDTFSHDFSYKDGLGFSDSLPKAVLSFASSKRSWQISQFRRMAKKDWRLINPFLEGMKNGLKSLDKDGLRVFLTLGLEKFDDNEKSAIKFISLKSRAGIDQYKKLLVTVSLSHTGNLMARYVQARTGRGIMIKPASSLPGFWGESIKENNENFVTVSDGKAIWLPDEINLFHKKEDNKNLYKCLAKLESARFEFGSFDFDLEKALELSGKDTGFEGDKNLCDHENFFRLFPVPGLARDLFDIFDRGRIRIILKRKYPGIVRSSFPILQKEADRMENKYNHPLWNIYRAISLGDEPKDSISKKTAKIFNFFVKEKSPVEICADLVFQSYDMALPITGEMKKGYNPLVFPFGRKFCPDLFFENFRKEEELAKKIKALLKKNGLKAYKSDIRKKITEKRGVISPEDIKGLVIMNNENNQEKQVLSNLLRADFSGISDSENPYFPEDDPLGPALWYKEWDRNLQDYLHDHVRVVDKKLPEIRDDFYDSVLFSRYGLISRIQRAFELMKPQSLAILRQWTEGDEFDYRAMLDFAIDKKAGIMPSDKLYIKRVKQIRDVAVLLLVDLSRSTANKVFDSDFSVLDLEKEAIVLFCEALGVLGDLFAVAGFSGSGRLRAEYLRIKDFDEPLDEPVKHRISAMSPMRNTRMGAAIRHGAAQLMKTDAKVKLMIILSDGFPNDTGYKREYAIEDTRKAISEALANHIHTRAITVNILGSSGLDDLYGSLHHNVISDVRELPIKLLRIYSALTK